MKILKYIYFLYAVTVFVIVAPAYSSDKRFDVPLADSPALGPANAPVTVIEFLDYQ